MNFVSDVNPVTPVSRARVERCKVSKCRRKRVKNEDRCMKCSYEHYKEKTRELRRQVELLQNESDGWERICYQYERVLAI